MNIKVLAIIGMCLMCTTAANAANVQLKDFTPLAAPVGADLLFAADVSTSSQERKITISQIFSDAITSGLSPKWANEYVTDYTFYTSDDGTHTFFIAAGNNTTSIGMKWPTALPASGTEALMVDSLGNMSTSDVVLGDSVLYTQDSQPGTCAVGDMWVDTNGTSGQRIYTCESTNTWVAQAGGSGGYTNLTSFVDQTAWRIFYSNTNGDVTELALGTSGQYLKSNGASSAPSWDTPSGSMVYPGAGIPASTGSAWGTSYTLDTDLTSVSGSDDTIPSAKATKTALDLKSPIASPTFTGTVTAPAYATNAADGSRKSELPNNTSASPTGGGVEEIYNEGGQIKVVEADTEYNLLHSGDVDDTPSDGNTGEPASSNSVYDGLALKAPIADAVMTGSFALPQGTGPTVDAAGEIAVDTTSGQLAWYSGSKRVVTNKFQENFAVKTPVDADDFLLFKAQQAITISDIHVIAQGGTSISVDVQECDSAGANCATVDAAITADTDGAEDDGTLSNGTIDAGDWVKIVLGAPSGTVNYLAGSIYYTITAD